MLSLFIVQPACYSSLAAVQIEQTGTVPILRVNVVARGTKAINYRHRGGATKVDFAGTALQPKAYGEAQPVASNAIAAGKQQNRRVELVVSGEPIGVSVGSLR